MNSGRFQDAITRIDAANAQDPHGIELPYAQRLSAWVERLAPDASEELRLAARAQHICRWTIPRATYPPGSIFKFATAFAALEDGQGAEDENIFCTGEYELSGTHFSCHGTHGKINLLGAIQHSCDTYFWTLAERVGIEEKHPGDFGAGHSHVE